MIARKALATVLAFLLSAWSAPSVKAQDAADPGVAQPTPQISFESPGLRLLQDRAFDRSSYMVGPGDILAISTTGGVDLYHELVVTPEGRLLIPSVGIVSVLGLDLDEAEERVSEAVAEYYRNVEVHLTLRSLRKFKVFVVGAVPEPGPREASAATRVSELLEEEVAPDPRGLSGNEAKPTPAAISQRNVLLIRAGGDTLNVDLVRFRQTGDVSFNPTLQSGDMILVPGLDESVRVEGRVFFPGVYEYREDESLADLLSVANGYRGFPSDAHDTIHVSRFVDEQSREFFTMSREQATGERGHDFQMRPFDAVFVPTVSHYKEQKTASVEGEVRNPGTYPIRPDTTTVRELVRMAGGFTEDASLVNARLVRVPQSQVKLVEGDSTVPVELLSDLEKRIMEVRRRGGEGNVVVDFEALYQVGQDVYDLPLQHEDQITIPERREDVTVLGAVREPGIVEYRSGRTIEDYVALAGGYTERGDQGDVVVLKSKLQVQLERDEVEAVESGDTIIVPYEVKRDWLAIYQTTTGFVTSVTSLILFFIAATQ